MAGLAVFLGIYITMGGVLGGDEPASRLFVVAGATALLGLVAWKQARPSHGSLVVVVLMAVFVSAYTYRVGLDGGDGLQAIDVDARVVTGKCTGTEWIMSRVPPQDFDPSSTKSLRINDAAVASPQLVELQIFSKRLGGATIRSIDFEVVSTDSVSSTDAAFFYPCKEPVVARFIGYDFDTEEPLASSSIETDVRQALADDATEGPVLGKPIVFPYEINGNENLPLVLAVVTSKDVQWRAKLNWTQGADSGSVLIDDAGEPFRVANGEGLVRVGQRAYWLRVRP